LTQVTGYPASEYGRATLYYLDEKGQTVNVASPGGGISTTQFNNQNEVTRTLSSDNRQAALNAGETKSSAVAEALSTKNVYNEPEAGKEVIEPGTKLLETLGPEHKIKLEAMKESETGAEVEARTRTVYAYNAGAPSSGGPYHLVTNVTTAAKLANGEEKNVRETTNSYENLGWTLRKPIKVTTAPNGLSLAHETVYSPETGAVLETKTPRGAAEASMTYFQTMGFEGSAPGGLSRPFQPALDSEGNVWVTDCGNNRVEKFSSEGKELATYGPEVPGKGTLSCPRGIAINQTAHTAYVVDSGNDRVVLVSTTTGGFQGTFGSAGQGAGQLQNPAGVALDSSGDVWVADQGNQRIAEFSPSGGFTLGIGWGVNGKPEAGSCTTSCVAGTKGSGNGQFSEPNALAIAGGNLYVTNTARIEELTSAGAYVGELGKIGGVLPIGRPDGIATGPEGNLYVMTRGFAQSTSSALLELSPSLSPLAGMQVSPGSAGGQLSEPFGVAVNASGDVYVADSGNGRLEAWRPADRAVDDKRTIYYTAAANSSHTECGERPEWAELVCRTEPAVQPNTPGVPNIPVTIVRSYNVLGEALETEEVAGSATRKKTVEYDSAGRFARSEMSASEDQAVPKLKNEYDAGTGALIRQVSESAAEGTKTISSSFNTLAQLTSYVDANGLATTYEYDVDGRPTNVSYGTLNEGKDHQTYVYSPISGLITELIDSEAGVFTASYDPGGKITSERYPDGMSASYAYNAAGETTSLQYLKPTGCSANCTLYGDSAVPSVHGQTIAEEVSFEGSAIGKEYAYDEAGRLTRAKESPAGQSSTTRLYTYDEETNRTALTTIGPSGATSESHVYDEASRLIEPSVQYDQFGNTTKLPAPDAGGAHELASTYYADNQLATQLQGPTRLEYSYDPAGRPLKLTKTEGASTSVKSYYGGSESTPAFEEETQGSEHKLTRNVDAFGGLAAISHSNEPVPLLQLRDLRGDVVGHVPDTQGQPKLEALYNSTEFGVPTTSEPPKHAFLGAIGLSTELPSGVVAMGARSYVPQLGRFLQDDPVEGGSANAYAYTFGDPVNSVDPSGSLTYGSSSWGAEFAGQVAAEAAERAAANEAALRAEVEAEEARWASEAEEEGEEGEGEAVAVMAVGCSGMHYAPPCVRRHRVKHYSCYQETVAVYRNNAHPNGYYVRTRSACGRGGLTLGEAAEVCATGGGPTGGNLLYSLVGALWKRVGGVVTMGVSCDWGILEKEAGRE
jgi:RHS repeat-associated protein